MAPASPARGWGATALLAVLAVATGCSSEPAPPSAPSVAAPSGVASPGARVAPLPKSPPIRVQIRAIGVDSPLMELGLRADGTMQVPPAELPAGWYTGGADPR